MRKLLLAIVLTFVSLTTAAVPVGRIPPTSDERACWGSHEQQACTRIAQQKEGMGRIFLAMFLVGLVVAGVAIVDGLPRKEEA